MSNIKVPNFIAASSPPELVERMFQNSIKKNSDITYFDISFDGKKWFAWHYETIDLDGLLSKVNTKLKSVK